MNNILSSALTDGINLHLAKSEKFKTNLLSLYIKIPVIRENATLSALLPKVLRRGSKIYPSLSAIATNCEELYGASYYSGLRKKGDCAFLYFTLEFVSGEYLKDSNILSDAMDFLKELVFNPKIKNGVFDNGFVDSEKINLKDDIESLINDKKEYADQRVKEISFEGSPYGIAPFGFKEDIDSITPESLYQYYKKVITECKMDFFLSGAFDTEKAKELFGEKFSDILSPRNPSPLSTSIAKRKDEKIKRVTDKMDVTQSKLCITMFTDTDPFSSEYYASAVFNCIYGGSPFSKLFNNVREKLSLAYYVSSRLDRQKGCILISSGIENDKFQDAYSEIMLWLDKIKAGEFSDEEISSAKKYLETNLNSIADSLRASEDYLISALSDERQPETIESLVSNLNKVTRDEIIKIANKVQPDTVYLLTGKDI